MLVVNAACTSKQYTISYLNIALELDEQSMPGFGGSWLMALYMNLHDGSPVHVYTGLIELSDSVVGQKLEGKEMPVYYNKCLGFIEFNYGNKRTHVGKRLAICATNVNEMLKEGDR